MIFVLEVDFNLEEKRYKKLFTKLSQSRQIKVNSFYNENDKIISTLTEIFIKYCLEQYIGKKLIKLELIYNNYGKPRLKDFPNIYFNISHSGNIIVCSVNNQQLGIDVEKVKKFDFNIIDMFCNVNDINHLKDVINKNIALYKIWTAKEAFLKFKGTGLVDDIKNISINYLNQDIVMINNFIKINYFWIKDYLIATTIQSSIYKSINTDILYNELKK